MDGDWDADGDIDQDDLDDYAGLWLFDDPLADVDGNGTVEPEDLAYYYASWTNGWTASGGLSVVADNRFGYAGYMWDRHAKAYHVRNRVYDPALGRWINRDPILYWGGSINLFEYAFGNPGQYIDPLGLYGLRDYWRDATDGLKELRDTWKEIGDDPSKYRDWAGDDGAIDEVQDALAVCECIPGAEQIVAPINIGLDLLQGDCKGAAVTFGCSLVPGPGGPGKSLPSPGLIPVVPPKPTLPNPYPKNPLPKHPQTGYPIPDPDKAGRPHVQWGEREGRKGPYTQAREWGEDAECPVRDVDFTDHGRPKDHTNPHQHPWTKTPSGPERGPARPYP